jgi:hypothetical protein
MPQPDFVVGDDVAGGVAVQKNRHVDVAPLLALAASHRSEQRDQAHRRKLLEHLAEYLRSLEARRGG